MKTIFIISAINIVLFFFGCATATGPLFKEVSLEEYKGKAIVYFYRYSQVGAASSYNLMIDKRTILPLQNKGYQLLDLNPGSYNFAVYFESKLLAENTFTFQEDKTYYIRYQADVVGYNPGFVTSNPIYKDGIVSVPREEALDILKKCRHIE